MLPVFNNPLKLAGQIGMLDAISRGRLEVGFARAFLPHEFARFGISMDESRARFDEGVEQMRRLLEEENVTAQGRFHSFDNVTSLPRPTQKPRPPFWIAALVDQGFVRERRPARPSSDGHPARRRADGGAARTSIASAWTRGRSSRPRPGDARLPHVLRRRTRARRPAIAREPLNIYLKSIVNAASDWMSGVASKDYPNYQKTIEFISKETFETQVEKGSAWIGTPDDIRKAITQYDGEVGGFESASLQVNFGMIPCAEAEASMKLFARDVMPHFQR